MSLLRSSWGRLLSAPAPAVGLGLGARMHTPQQALALARPALRLPARRVRRFVTSMGAEELAELRASQRLDFDLGSQARCQCPAAVAVPRPRPRASCIARCAAAGPIAGGARPRRSATWRPGATAACCARWAAATAATAWCIRRGGWRRAPRWVPLAARCPPLPPLLSFRGSPLLPFRKSAIPPLLPFRGREEGDFSSFPSGRPLVPSLADGRGGEPFPSAAVRQRSAPACHCSPRTTICPAWPSVCRLLRRLRCRPLPTARCAL